MCPYCGGVGTLLGILGRLYHWRCRDCGATYSTTENDQEDDES